MKRLGGITDKRRILGLAPGIYLQLHTHRSAWQFQTQEGITVYGSTSSIKRHLGIPIEHVLRISRRGMDFHVRSDAEDRDRLSVLFDAFTRNKFFSAFDSTGGILLAVNPKERYLTLTRNTTTHFETGTTHEAYPKEPYFIIYTSALIGVQTRPVPKDVTYRTLEQIQKNI